MALLSPVATQIKFTGCWADLETPAGSDSGSYDPTAPTDFKEGVTSGGRLRGIYSDGRLENLDARFKGLFRIAASAMPPGLTPEKTNLILLGQTYQINSVRTRFFRGVIDGFDLVLAA